MKTEQVKILLVEDDEEDADFISEMINRINNLDANLVTVDYLSKAINQLSNDKFDVILTDLGLPDSQKIETLTKILEYIDSVPIIVMTGLDDESVGIEAVSRGAQDYLIKGKVDSNLLARVIRYSIERKKMETELKRYAEHLEEEVQQRTNELIQSEKMIALGQLVAGVAHEINNPLGYLTSNTEYIKECLLSINKDNKDQNNQYIYNSLIKLLKTNLDGINRIADITKSLKRFAIPNTDGKYNADINQGIKDTLKILHNQLKHRIRVHENYGNFGKLICNIGQLNQVFMNLLMNASQAMDEGDIWIRTWTVQNYIFIEIQDNGCGIKKDKINNIFDPFYTTKEDGTGLGLSVSYRIINDHKGTINVESKENEGTKILIKLAKEEKK